MSHDSSIMRTYVVTWQNKYIISPPSTRAMATKQGKVVTFPEGAPPINSHNPLNTWSCEITWQTEKIIPHLRKNYDHYFVKSVQMWSFFWSEFRKLRTGRNSVFGHFSRRPLNLADYWLQGRSAERTPKSSLNFCKALWSFSILYSTTKSNFRDSLFFICINPLTTNVPII